MQVKFNDTAMLTKQERVIVLFLAGACLCGLLVLYHRNFATPPVTPQVTDESQEESEAICVDVSGAVWKPGVYKLEKGARTDDALVRAMLRPDADVDAINRAAFLKDGQKIVVPVKGSSTSGSFQKKININQATAEELKTLPHIGQIRSRDIINYRNTHGPFTSVEELKNVPGIGEETLKRLKDLVVAE